MFLSHQVQQSYRTSLSANVFIHSISRVPWNHLIIKKIVPKKPHFHLFAYIKIRVKWVTCEEGENGPAA